MGGADRPPLVGVYPRRYTDRGGMGRINALVTSVYTLSESLPSTTLDLAPFRTQETRKQVAAGESEMSPDSQPATIDVWGGTSHFFFKKKREKTKQKVV